MTEPNPGRLLARLEAMPKVEAFRLVATLEGELVVLEENPPEGRQNEVKRLAAIVRQGRAFLGRKYPPTSPLSIDAILDKVKERIEKE